MLLTLEQVLHYFSSSPLIFCCQIVHYLAVTSCLIPNATSLIPGSGVGIIPAVYEQTG